MTEAAAIMLTGVVVGLASAFHCAAMCGGISLTILTMLHGETKSPDSASAPVLPLLTIQAGRITVYVVRGAIAGLSGDALAGLVVEPRLSARLLQWAAAASIMWIGLSLAGVVPELSYPLSATPRASRLFEQHLRSLNHPRLFGAYGAGFSWFLCPCPIVHAALFSAMFTGSASGGALLMAAFGVGTLPANLASAMGLSLLRRFSLSFAPGLGLGLCLVALGLYQATVGVPSGMICLTQ